MTFLVLTGAYFAVGLAFVWVRVRAGDAAGEATLWWVAWPVLLPFAVGQPGDAPQASPVPRLPPDHPAAALQLAVLRAAGTPMATLLPDQATVSHLADRLHRAHIRAGELNALAADPTFCVAAVRRRVRALEAAGAHAAAKAASGRLQNLDRLHGLQRHADAELRTIEELLRQLHVQAELVRLSGRSDDDALIADICARIEGLDEVLDPSLSL